MLSGLPASGKTTTAQEMLAKAGNGVRLNRDLLREMLHFGKWTPLNEKKTIEAEKELAGMFLADGVNVIVDDTNLSPGHKDMWQHIADLYGAKFQHVRIKTGWKECVLRDVFREKTVGQDMIVQMAMQHGYMDPPEKGYVVCDLDGTIADISHRLHLVKGVEKKDWKGFFEAIPLDTLRIDVLDQLKPLYDAGYDIVFVSARPDTYRNETTAWLTDHVLDDIDYLTLIMRRSGDRRPDTEVKEDILNKYLGGGKHIHKVFDDRPSVIRMWREHGLDVVDCGSGIEF